jgi:hypothetical protein
LPTVNEINFGDYIRACVALEAGPEAALEIAHLLELAVNSAAPRQESQEVVSDYEAPISGSGVIPEDVSTADVSTPAGSTLGAETRMLVATHDTPDIPAELTPLPGIQMDASFKTLKDIPDEPFHSKPDMPPLFQPLQTRTLLSRALARVARTGPWDFVRVIEECARGHALTNVPRLPEPTLSGGVQLLVDRSDTMLVFSQDQAQIEIAIRRLVGDNKLQVLAFDGFPSSAGRRGKRRWKPYNEQMPPPGTVVAVLSDFGIGHAAWLPSPAPVESWQGFAETLRRRGCPVVAFVPYHPRRWPSELRRVITMIHWDRPTRTSTMRAFIGFGLRPEK